MEQGEEHAYQVFLDTSMETLTADCLDYFRVALTRDYPDLHFDKMVQQVGWLISLPAHRTYTIGNVDAKAITVQEDLFWKKDILVRYLIIRDDDDLEESEEE